MKHTTLPIIPNSTTEVVLNNDPAEVQAAKIQAVFLNKQEAVKPGTISKAATLRQRILSVSLFPNVHNKKFITRYGE